MKLTFDEHEVVCMGQQKFLPRLQTDELYISSCYSGRHPGGAANVLVCSVVVRKGSKRFRITRNCLHCEPSS